MERELLDYTKIPVFIAHTDGNNGVGKTVIFEGDGDRLTIQPNAEGVLLNGIQFYQGSVVDSLLEDLHSNLISVIESTEIGIKEWANDTFAEKEV